MKRKIIYLTIYLTGAVLSYVANKAAIIQQNVKYNITPEWSKKDKAHSLMAAAISWPGAILFGIIYIVDGTDETKEANW